MSDSSHRIGNQNVFRVALSENAATNRENIDHILTEAKQSFGAGVALDRFEFRLKSGSDGQKYLELREQTAFGRLRELIGSRSGARNAERQEAVMALGRSYPGLADKMPTIFNLGERASRVAAHVTRADAHSIRSLLTGGVKEFETPSKTEQEARKNISEGWTSRSNKVGAYSDVDGQKIYTSLIGDLLDRSKLSYQEGALIISRGGQGIDGRVANLAILNEFITDATGFQKGTPEFDNALSNTFRYMKQDFEADLPQIFHNAVGILPLLGDAQIQLATKITTADGVISVERSASVENFNVFENKQKTPTDYHVSLEQKFKIPIEGLSQPPEQFDHENLVDAEHKERVWQGGFDPRMPLNEPDESNEPFVIVLDENFLAKDQEQVFKEFLDDIRTEPDPKRMVRTRRPPKAASDEGA